jgi:shikimate kinase
MKKSNIILIGMPGCGKSTVGVVLAKNLGYRFLDSDICIQEQENCLLHEIIAREGMDGFLAIENQVNASLEVENHVIATGGSAIYGTEAMEHLSAIGTIVYLKLPYEEIKERLGDLVKRGVTFREGQTLLDLYEERVPLYEKYADITVDCIGKPIREIVHEIADKHI